jgi:hypothetical protein
MDHQNFLADHRLATSVLKNMTFHLRTETNPVSETTCSLKYRTMDKVQKLSNPEMLFSVRIIRNPINTLCGQSSWFYVKVDGTYSYHCALKGLTVVIFQTEMCIQYNPYYET